MHYFTYACLIQCTISHHCREDSAIAIYANLAKPARVGDHNNNDNNDNNNDTNNDDNNDNNNTYNNNNNNDNNNDNHRCKRTPPTPTPKNLASWCF